MKKTANPGRILVVEDEPLVNLAVTEALCDDGFEPISVHTAEEGLAILEREPDVDVVFTDVNLPGRLNGIALVHEVKRRWPEVEVLVTSSHPPPEIGELMIVAHDNRFVPKPYVLEQVVRRIHDLVGGRIGARFATGDCHQ